MHPERILYVCFDPALLVDRERQLIDDGYEVHTVLGQDGVLAVKNLGDFDFVLLGDEGSLLERQRAVHRLRQDFFPPPIVALCRPSERLRDADYVVLDADSESWCSMFQRYVRRSRRLA